MAALIVIFLMIEYWYIWIPGLIFIIFMIYSISNSKTVSSTSSTGSGRYYYNDRDDDYEKRLFQDGCANTEEKEYYEEAFYNAQDGDEEAREIMRESFGSDWEDYEPY